MQGTKKISSIQEIKGVTNAEESKGFWYQTIISTYQISIPISFLSLINLIRIFISKNNKYNKIHKIEQIHKTQIFTRETI